MPKKTKDKITISIFMDIPPPQVRLADLHDNGLLLSDEDIERAQTQIRSPGRLHKSLSGLPLDVIRDEKNRLYAVYYGESKYEHRGSGLGKGVFGKVKLVQELETGKWYALKSENKVRKKNTEAIALEKLDSLIFSYRHNKPKKQPTEHIMELARGQHLQKLIKLNLPLLTKINFIISVAEQLKAMDEKQLIHRDIKLKNIVGNPLTGEAKLVDHGLTIEADDTGVFHSTKFCGTPWYTDAENLRISHRNDEIIERNEKRSANSSIPAEALLIHEYSQKTDCYAFGKVICELLFDTKNCVNLLGKVKVAYPDIYPIVKDMLSKNRAERPEYDTVIAYFEQIKKSLVNITTRKVGYLHMAPFVKANKEVKLAILKELKKYDHVCIMHNDKQRFSAKDYSDVAQLLLDFDIYTENHVVIYPTGNIALAEKQYAEYLRDKNILETTCATFAKNAIILLREEKKRLELREKLSTGRSKTILTARISFLDSALAKFEDKPADLNDYSVHQVLTYTSGKMHSTSKSFLMRFFRPSTGERKLRKFLKDNPNPLKPKR